MNNNKEKIDIVLVSSCDGLAGIAARKLLDENENWKIVAVVKTNVSLKDKLKLVWKAIKKKSLYYAIYIQYEVYAANRQYRKRYFQRYNPSCFFGDVQEKKINIFSTDNVNSKHCREFIKHFKPDLVLSVRPGHIFRQETIQDCSPILNLHCSRLPWHAGIGGVLQALAAGDSELGTTVHLIESEKIDSGGIIRQGFFPVHQGKSVLWHTLKLYDLSADVLYQALKNWSADTLEITTNEKGSYNSWPGRIVYKRLINNGHTLTVNSKSNKWK